MILGILVATAVKNRERKELKKHCSLEETLEMLTRLSAQATNDCPLHPVLRVIDNEKLNKAITSEHPQENPQMWVRDLIWFMKSELQSEELIYEGEFLQKLTQRALDKNYGRIFSKSIELRLALFFAVDYIRNGQNKAN